MSTKGVHYIGTANHAPACDGYTLDVERTEPSKHEPVELGIYDTDDCWVCQFGCENIAAALVIVNSISRIHGR